LGHLPILAVMYIVFLQGAGSIEPALVPDGAAARTPRAVPGAAGATAARTG
jgi:hypothetical protein